MKRILLSVFMLITGSSVFAQYWSVQNTAFTTASRGISGLEVYDANTVWAFAYDGATSTNNVQEFTKTSNGGTTWTSGAINIGDPDLRITNISGVSSTTAWVGAFDDLIGLGGVWKTTDAGVTWTQQKALTTPNQSWTNFVHFFDANNGIVGGDPEGGEFELYTTSNGGSTWTRVAGANIPNPLAGEYGYNSGYYANGNNIFFYTGKGRIFKSTDKGLTWAVVFTGSTYGLTDFGGATIGGDMAWSDANKGIVFKKTYNTASPPVQTGLAIYGTTDGGTTWNSITFTGITAANGINDVTYVPGTSILVATSSAGGSWKSVDNGVTWTSIDTGVQHLNVRCSDSNTCYSGGFNTSSTVGGMFKSTQNLGVSDVINKKNKALLIYPNPTKGEVSVKADKKIITSNVIDITGKSVLKAESEKVNLSSLPAGTYFLQIDFTDGTSTSEKVIKE
ncbi:T9SS type A sorting domain-containing protein [Chryseobacterium sp. Y16C]|uniref:T9SS type A sorting domain-containing protein n=1 Tax=Chryseobacterium sp. Y16C TaxID=2920939 RepID=UPI001F0AB0AD|nr:T9SS type A sorting domain-containing protein [Chryseobacterium sp. Y16C]UMQ40424.1 T9SS type A sorting domain-containing protein [Chryseobacterium sp. Y16C]